VKPVTGGVPDRIGEGDATPGRIEKITIEKIASATKRGRTQISVRLYRRSRMPRETNRVRVGQIEFVRLSRGAGVL
jgi:hypothetical protein